MSKSHFLIGGLLAMILTTLFASPSARAGDVKPFTIEVAIILGAPSAKTAKLVYDGKSCTARNGTMSKQLAPAKCVEIATTHAAILAAAPPRARRPGSHERSFFIRVTTESVSWESLVAAGEPDDCDEHDSCAPARPNPASEMAIAVLTTCL